MRLEHKVAVITGAYGGMGRASARLIAKEEATIFIAGRNLERGGIMGRSAAIVLYVLAMVVVVVAVDLLFFRNHFWPRLMANVGIVLVFGAFYFRFLQRT
jgi:hypothetical protein